MLIEDEHEEDIEDIRIIDIPDAAEQLPLAHCWADTSAAKAKMIAKHAPIFVNIFVLKALKHGGCITFSLFGWSGVTTRTPTQQ